ncbi:Retrovirus-related Pol polyprotein from transposon TNT 1-94 [Gossypium australe]|uniref:Retrovirus-related Pol polyprotein from transposon TNT 1-94 n=1 Tax=Gossypium australe TaxID=47621 RepID=A0A5B6W7D5_9ROSI|nr:Retrovirus-related Pol polyprotein from transposon TNT 1-94 [Gossypium australe]
MDANSVFLNNFLKEEVYVDQPKDFEDLTSSGHGGTFLSQEKYARNLVKKFGLENSKPTRTPRSIIESLLYLTTSRLDLCFNVEICARYQANPKESHVKVVKRSFRYVHGTSDLGIWFSKDSLMSLISYRDVDRARNNNDQKDTLGECFYLGSN